jgi:small-conductance mechanosensitive channel
MPDSFAQALHDWQSFYLLTGGAAATLTGLMFVAISLTAGLTERSAKGLRAWLDPTLYQFVSALVIALVLLIPTMTSTVLGILLSLWGLISVGLWVRVLRRMLEHRGEQPLDVLDWLWYRVLPLASHFLILGAGIGLLRGVVQAVTLVALASLLLLIVGIVNAWDLVLEIAQYRAEKSRGQRER